MTAVYEDKDKNEQEKVTLTLVLSIMILLGDKIALRAVKYIQCCMIVQCV